VLVGDVDPFDVAEKAAAYSPVPGGVGADIAMLWPHGGIGGAQGGAC